MNDIVRCLWLCSLLTAYAGLFSQDGYADNRSETSQGTVVQDGKFSMMEFALLHFRESLQK